MITKNRPIHRYFLTLLLALLPILGGACGGSSTPDDGDSWGDSKNQIDKRTKYCIFRSVASVTLAGGETATVQVGDGGCDPITPALPWGADYNPAYLTVSFADKNSVSTTMTITRTPAPAGIQLREADTVAIFLINVPFTLNINDDASISRVEQSTSTGNSVDVIFKQPNVTKVDQFPGGFGVEPPARAFLKTKIGTKSLPVTFTVVSRDNDILALHAFTSATFFGVSPTDFILPSGGSKPLTATFTPDREGRVLGNIYIQVAVSTDRPKSATLSVNGIGEK